ncbi:zinc-dependent alcohol dehydrogenase family protein [Ruminococcaceae bacterium OttesenSCG-928-L11]|nr:zinc-dependent alcohol dehydrogenase family protein [Ruminococcaceae bacterium OttesenSCG-928-L11]
MKCAVFHGIHDIRIEEHPVPVPGPGEALIRVKACGVCGTDVHIYEGDKGAADTTPPTILGHEFAGVVESVGPGVTEFQAGDRVCVDPNQLCGTCYYCKSGIGHYCTGMTGIGTTTNGGFAEYCAVPVSQLYRLADHTTFAQGAMTEPLACCLHGIDLCEIKPGATVAVIGGGMIGLLMLQLAGLSGAATRILIEPVAAKRATGAALGADLCIDPFQENPAEVLAKNGIHRVDTVIECAGLPSTVAQAIDIAGNYSVVMLFGLTKPDDTVAIKPFTLFQKEITLKASFINPYTQQRALNLINAGRVDVTSMVCDPVGLDKLPAVLSDPALRAKGKYIVTTD